MQRLIDLHAHPYMKIHLLPYLAKNLHALTYNGSHWNPLALRYQFVNLRRSPVKVLLNTHYVVERDFLKSGLKAPLQALFYGLLPLHFHRLRNVSDHRILFPLVRSSQHFLKVFPYRFFDEQAPGTWH